MRFFLLPFVVRTMYPTEILLNYFAKIITKSHDFSWRYCRSRGISLLLPNESLGQ